MRLFSGSSHPALTAAIADGLGIEVGKVCLKDFSCGECYVRYEESVRGKDVYIVQTGSLNVNQDIVELCLMCQAAKLSFASSVHLVIPHFPYARQDRVAEVREPISSKLIAQLLESAGADHIVTLDLHSDQIQGFFSIPVDSLKARKLFAQYFLDKGLEDPVVVSPDEGGAKRAKKLADMIGADLAIMHKTRPQHQQAEIVEVVGAIEGRTCILFDDMIDTAGSLCSAKDALLERGANADVYAAATHGIFSGPAADRLTKAQFKEVIVTDTIPNEPGLFPSLQVISTAPLLTDVIKNISAGKSVTKVYDEQ